MVKNNKDVNMQDKSVEEEFWDKCAEKRVYAAFDKEEYNKIFDRYLMNIQKKKVIDVGCASGISAMLLAMRGAEVTGIDISPKLIDQANSLKKDTDFNVEFKVGDAEELDFVDESVDACFYGGVIHHFPDKSKCIKDCYRVLKNQGKFLAIEPNYGDFFQRINWKIARRKNLLSINEDLVDPVELKDLLKKEGFEDIEFFTFRVHVSFIGLLIPKLKRYFKEHGKSTLFEKIIRFPFDIFKDKNNIGNFFCITGTKIKVK